MKTLNEKELREICKCSKCKKGVMHTGMPFFWHLKISRYGIKSSAVKRQAGLEQFMGGNVALAQVFSTGEDMAERIGDEDSLTFCEDCMLQYNSMLMGILKDINDKK